MLIRHGSGDLKMNKDTVIAALLAGVISALLNILIIFAG